MVRVNDRRGPPSRGRLSDGASELISGTGSSPRSFRVTDIMNSSTSRRRWNQDGFFRGYLCTHGIFSLVAALSLGLPLARATSELPSTPAGKVLAGYLEALDSGNKDKLETFIKAHRPDRPDALDRLSSKRT